MNKQQIIAPLVAMAIVAIVGLFIFTRNQSRGFLLAGASTVGSELISTTNSPHLRLIAPELHGRLVDLLGSPTTVASVVLGDEPSPIGDGRASVRLFLQNQVKVRLGIRLRWNADNRQFDVLGFWTP